MSVAAVRCFRARPLVDGLREGAGALLLLCALAVLLHLPFAGSDVSQHGPGGLFGQWLGEVAASFIGAVGAALAATTMLVVGVLLVTEISLQEAMVVLAWAGAPGPPRAGGRRSRRLADRARGLPREGRRRRAPARAASPRPTPKATTRRSRSSSRCAPAREPEPRARAPRRAPRAGRIESQESEAIRVGAPRTVSDEVAEERAAMAAIVAEVAAVERFAADEAEAEDEAGRCAEATVALAPIAAARRADHRRVGVAGPACAEEAARRGRADDEERREAPEEKMGFIRLGEGAFQLPTTDLLEYIPPQAPDMDKQQLYDMAERLEQAMSNYGVRGKVKEIHMGPVVTMYEFAPAPGTRTGKIANLENDLAMALEAQAVRIVAPIPGKAVVGIEVPNKTRETVYLKEILQDSSFTGAASKLQVGARQGHRGRAGQRQPGQDAAPARRRHHRLGQVGRGQRDDHQPALQRLARRSPLHHGRPEDARALDLRGHPAPAAAGGDRSEEGEPGAALGGRRDGAALRAAGEVGRARHRQLQREHRAAERKAAAVPRGAAAASEKKIRVVIAGPDGTEQEVDLEPTPRSRWPRRPTATAPGSSSTRRPATRICRTRRPPCRRRSEQAAAEPQPTKLPYIVIVIDEFADLMMVAPKDVETSVARIAQKARAAGLHLILATQRPSVDVITGLIKANFPSRIAFQVASKIDSRTILDQPGAETLLGNGDMLFSDRGTKLRRIHGAFLTDDEVHRVVDFLKKQAKPVYDMDILKPREEDAEEGGAPADNFRDDLYDQAVAIVCDTRQASVSFIQRRLQIGYNRAARMVEQMERDGIVGPTNGAKPREVLAPQGEYLAAGG